MKVAILGAAGVRTLLMLRAFFQRQAQVGVSELALMDIDGARLEMIRQFAPESGEMRLNWTTDAAKALHGADFVITTFRVGGIESRVIDERVPLRFGVLGQETTGPGGFAMGLRSIPVLLGYIEQMRELCPDAWLLNFANPSGMMAEAAWRVGGWQRSIGICDSPSAMAQVAAGLLGVPAQQVYLDYFGLNHLGWVRRALVNQQDVLPGFLAQVQQGLKLPDLPFSPEFLNTLGMIPNEYLYYYYNARQAVEHLLRAEQTRGEYLAEINTALFTDLARLQGRPEEMKARYRDYLGDRQRTYMVTETGQPHESESVEAAGSEGYAGVALDIITALSGGGPRHAVLNVVNAGAVSGMAADDVVEIPVYLGQGLVQPMAVGEIPGECLGLMKQVKAYERLTIEAAVTHSYTKALQALTIHPLVADAAAARSILDGYLAQHGDYFPALR